MISEFTVEILGTSYPAFYANEINEIECLASILASGHSELIFGLDFETQGLSQWQHLSKAGLSPHLSTIRLVQVFNDDAVYVFDMNVCRESVEDYVDFNKTPVLKDFLSTRTFVAHNALFEICFLLKHGIEKPDVHCTLLLSRMLFHATRPTDADTSASLASMVTGIFGETVAKENQASDWSAELTFEQIMYAAKDAIYTCKLFEKLYDAVIRKRMKDYYELVKEVQEPIAWIQLNGIKLDLVQHRKLVNKWREDLFLSKQELIGLTGTDKITPHTMADYLTKNLPPDLLAVWPRTETGKLQTDSHVFADFDQMDIVKPFSVFQKKIKLTTSFGNNLLTQLNPVTNRLHASYKICGARTGRLSCSAPNLQQLPRDFEVRNNFIAEEGNVFVTADYSQIEVRVIAELAEDDVLLDTYRNNVDVYKFTMSKILGKPMEDITKTERQTGKAIVLGRLFGLGAASGVHYMKKGYGITITEDEMRENLNGFSDLYQKTTLWQRTQAENAAVTLSAFTAMGKKRKLDPSNTYGPSMNTPVQGTASEIVQAALVAVNNRIRGMNAWLVNCVHDEIVVECHEEIADHVAELVVEGMTKAYQFIFPNGVINNLVEAHIGKTWAESKG